MMKERIGARTIYSQLNSVFKSYQC